MARLHRLDFLLQLGCQLGLVGTIYQHLQALFKKLVRRFLALESHHAVFAGDACKIHHALDHCVLFLDRGQEGLCHNTKAAQKNRQGRGIHDGKECSAENNEN